MTAGAQYDDPNRECVGLAPIWGEEEPPPPEGDAETKSTPKQTGKHRAKDTVEG